MLLYSRLVYSLSVKFPTLDAHASRFRQYVAFVCIWLISLSITSSRFTHIIAYVIISFLLKLNIIPLYHLVHPFTVDGHLVCVHVLAIVNNATVNTAVQIPVRVPGFSSLGFVLTVKLLGHMVILFNFLRNITPFFYRSYTISPSHGQGTRVPISLHPLQHR